MAHELPLVGKKLTVNEQINECLRIKFRQQLELREAERKLARLDEGNDDLTQLTEKYRQEIKQAQFGISQMDDKLEMLHEVLAELDGEDSGSTAVQG